MAEPRTAVVVAAGLGTRFLPLTREVPKPALPFLNRPLVHWVLDGLLSAGADRVITNLHHLPEGVRRAVLSHRGGFRAEFSFEREILGTAGLYNPIREDLPDIFLAANADLWFDADLATLTADLEAHPEALASLAVLPKPAGSSYTGLRVASGGTLEAFGSGGWMFAGLYAARKDLLDHLGKGGFLELVKDLLGPLLPSGRLRAIPLGGRWADLGTPAEYLEATRARLGDMAAGRMAIPEGSSLDSRNGQPVLLAATATLDRGAQVTGPLVLGPGVVVSSGAEVGDAVLLEGARLGGGSTLSGGILDAGGEICLARRESASLGPLS